MPPFVLDYFEGQRLVHAFEKFGNAVKSEIPIILLHGFPDDATAWRKVAGSLLAGGREVFAPYMRGCVPTRYAGETVTRSGRVEYRLGDILEFMDGLNIEKAVLVGHDMGAQTAQAAAMLHPNRVDRLVILNGHGLYNIAVAMKGARPSIETLHAGWYQWLFQTPLGEPMLGGDPKAFARYLWKTWSPGWNFSDAEFEQTAQSFDNPDWVPTVLSAYRMRTTGDDPDDQVRLALERFPAISVPTLNLQGERDAVDLFADTQLGQEDFYIDLFERRVIPECGHFLHRERPEEVAREISSFLQSTTKAPKHHG